MHVPDAPARRRRPGEPIPGSARRAGRLAARCDADRGRLAQLLTEELLTVRETFAVARDEPDPAVLAARLLATVLPRAIPPLAVAALAGELAAVAAEGGGSVSDVDVRVWFIAWSLGDVAHQPGSRRT